MYKPLIKIYGSGKPVVIVVGCAHGDELFGKRVISALSKIKIIKGTLITIIANPLAMKQKKRFIDIDLNRCFPGKKNGKLEEKIAYYLRDKIKEADYLIDIHSTTADTEDLALIKYKNKGVKKLIKNIGIKKVIFIKRTQGNHSLIKHCSSGIALEYCGRSSERSYAKALKDIKSFLIKEKMIKGGAGNDKTRKTEYYSLYGEEKRPKEFVIARTIKNFQLVKKGDLLGKAKGKKIFAQDNFYPLLFGEKSYKTFLGFKARKIGDIFK